MAKVKSFNLIKKKVEFKEKVTVERDWYSLFNIIVICLAVVFSLVAFLIQTGIESGIETKAANLSKTANTGLNTTSKEVIRARINVLEEKYSLYQILLDQDFDMNTFHDEVMTIYPNVKIDSFTAEPEDYYIELELLLPRDGYRNASDFISRLEENSRFGNSKVLGISFEKPESNSDGDDNGILEVPENELVTRIVLEVEREAPEAEEEYFDDTDANFN
ncbi:MAG: hypothetical protein ACOCXT_04365 [Candidatus Dojkabacteria bacterium]